tara:strand:- start:1922 stop:3007 length:1086 start_codon:yes stop_codon:yes gene_type:complete
LKVLHCINSPHIGGIERLVIELAIAQKKQGIEVSIMLDSRKGQYYEYLLNQDIPLLDSGIKGGFDFNFRTYKNLQRQFQHFDLLHLHSFSSIRSLAVKASKIKTIYTIHGLSKGIRKENGLKIFARETFKKYLLNKVDVLVANSQYTLSLAKEHYGLLKVKSLIILNGIKLPGNTIEHNETNSVFTIGLVSRFTSRKRIDRLVNAFEQYKLKNGQGKLVLVGDGTTFAAIKKQVSHSKYLKDIRLTGYKENVQDYYKKFDVLVFPSEAEPFGLVGVEAYIHGKPVLAFSDSGGLKEVIKPLEPENIVDNEEQLANRMLFYEQHQNMVMDKAKDRINYAKINFSIKRMERNYYDIYKTLMVI